ncbi:protein Mis18-beta [Hypanus sabinus]|uniref:protein Mis18-beta n=1 Tax=Hypanus sabinus TaxID=79690 RepID=UPI0028C50B9D|nr:protein Mis18-beta [Hypanus sabinus]
MSALMAVVGEASGMDEEMGFLELDDCVIFQCKKCHTVLGDSLQCCGSNATLNVLMCLTVTEDVRLDPTTFVGYEGPLTECLYRSLYCSFCRVNVGFVPVSTTDLYTHLRGLYCLDKTMLHCYTLQSDSLIEASALKLEPQRLTPYIGELKAQIVETYYRLMAAMTMLDELVEEECGLRPNTSAFKHEYKPEMNYWV